MRTGVWIAHQVRPVVAESSSAQTFPGQHRERLAGLQSQDTAHLPALAQELGYAVQGRYFVSEAPAEAVANIKIRIPTLGAQVVVVLRKNGGRIGSRSEEN